MSGEEDFWGDDMHTQDGTKIPRTIDGKDARIYTDHPMAVHRHRYVENIRPDEVTILSRVIPRPAGWGTEEWLTFWTRCKEAECDL